ncbi:MAG TPA: methylmalonyl-CoA mutase [Candidatus Marinimicrobia bacterium]|nr:methylmalonyl-CoA mutase [Candidatus Neomarinimicrobiota bacterium]
MNSGKAAEKYKPRNPLRIVTAASLFDGHDAAINIMRRIIQDTGVEVIHLGHNRSVAEIVECAIQEDAQSVAITSYQGGHIEFLKYMFDLFCEMNAPHIKIFAGGGGVILPHEIKELEDYGITRIYSPDDGREMGLQGMINDVVRKSDFPLKENKQLSLETIEKRNINAISRLITLAENSPDDIAGLLASLREKAKTIVTPVLGITGTGGSGKSSLVDELVRRFLNDFPELHIGIISVDPSKRRTGGALLGDRIRMNSIHNPRVFMRSLATRRSNLAVSPYVHDAVDILKVAAYDLIILETSGIGQSDTEIIDQSDLSMYVMTPEFGAPTQLEKIDMIDYAELIAINKFEKRGGLDALRDVRKQFARSRHLFDANPESLPVIGTTASQFNNPGVNQLYMRLCRILNEKTASEAFAITPHPLHEPHKIEIIPPRRVRYLSEIAETVRAYNEKADRQANLAREIQSFETVLEKAKDEATRNFLQKELEKLRDELEKQSQKLLDEWPAKKANYESDEFQYQVRNKTLTIATKTKTLSYLPIPKVILPQYEDRGELLRWLLKENVPGEFPYAAGVFPFKREAEDPTRMFAGEGGPERTNKRFHYVSEGLPFSRLSTAFDSVTLYGEDPAERPDIYGKIGNSGVSIATLDDAKKLYSGFDLIAPATSVSMTINGPAPAMTAFFLNAAIDQQCEKYIRQNALENLVEAKLMEKYDAKGLKRPRYEGGLPKGNDGLGLLLLGITGDEILPPEVYSQIKADTLAKVRGTVQADILKEDQAQNTCIFSTDFSLKMMGDMQRYFIEEKVRNFYSVSISGYHIAEAGANPITQLAFTLANGFTYVEYYLSRGMKIDDFAPNLSFFFSNGEDPEYAVMGRVARLIWAKAMREKYHGDERSQKLKYHIQTSGRSLHAQEIAFNDIRTTLQALYAIYDNCNSLHTNAYDEAITTPTEESVRRAMAIQLIINHELGLAKNQNPLQGSFIIEYLTDLVEAAVLEEFDRISERGGVLGAMESMYQRGKIQEESLYYERQKHSGKLKIIGVNTYLDSQGSPTVLPREVIRSTENEKQQQIQNLANYQQAHHKAAQIALGKLQKASIANENIFESLMEAAKSCSLGQISNALYKVGGQYRRNM